jgi:DNA-3-methyladenine glycosylase II
MLIQVSPVPPFDFDLTAMVFSDGDERIRTYEDGEYWQVVRTGDKLVLTCVTSVGSVEKPDLSLRLKSNELIRRADSKTVEETVSHLFNLRMDLTSFYEDVRDDEVMLSLAQRLRGLRSPSTPTVFEALVDSLIEQQISLKVAHGLEVRLVKALGDTVSLDGEVYYAYPLPETLADASVDQLRACGLSLRKAEYIQSVSRLVKDGDLDLEALKDLEDSSEIVAELDKIRGIGVWTAELTMVRGMQRFDVMPADDLGVRRCISHYYFKDRRISSMEARSVAQNWGKWKGLASFYLIVASILGTEV